MQKLHLVGFTTDHRSLILSPRRSARSGGFVLEIDEALATAVAEAVERAAARSHQAGNDEELSPPPPPRPESALPVRELQARLRAGRTVEEVAEEAGVDPAWVARFAAPVEAEQRRVIAAAQAATFERARLGPSALPMGEAVRRNLADRGLALTADELDAGWSARQVADGRWLVSLAYRSRGRRQAPSWELDVRTGTVRGRDRLAGELAYVAGRARPATTVPKPTRVPAAEPSEGDREVARRVTVARRAAEAQLDEAAREASKRDAEVARRGPTRPPAPAPAPTKKKPAKKRAATKTRAAKKRAAPTQQAAPAKRATAKRTTAKRTTAKKVAGRRQATRTKQAVTTKKATPKRAAPSRKRAAAGPPARRRTARTTATPAAVAGEAAAPEPTGGGDAVAQALAAVRREVEQELTAFATRTPIDLAELDVAPPAGPVFRGDVAPAGSPNGATPAAGAAGNPGPEPAAPRRRRSAPLRAR